LTIQFSEDEQKQIIKDIFNWHIAENCPKEIYKELKEKLDILNRKTYSYETGMKK
jgi:hypothetical protein